MSRAPTMFERLARMLSGAGLAERAPRVAESTQDGERLPHRAPSTRVRPRRRRPVLLEQLAMDLGPERPRWTFSRLVLKSAHQARIVEHLEFARRFFPELQGLTIRIGLAQKRGVLGWGSLDPERPGIWVRPRRLHLFTIAHEFTHLLQARELVPRGERSCDVYALARTPLLIDSPPSYLKLPRAFRRLKPTQEQAYLLCDLARRAIAAREAGDRRYLRHFEQWLEESAG